MLCFGAAVEAQDEVLTGVVDGALLARRVWEQEGAPIGDPADHAAGGEDYAAGCAGDSIGECVRGYDGGYEGSARRRTL